MHDSVAQDSAPEVVVVMPVYNEQASLRKVVAEWFEEFENWTENFLFLVVNDGSTDDSLKLLDRLKQRLGDRLVVHTHSNRGHGQSCLEGYRLAVQWGARYVFQIDSDGQCDPQYFFKFWRLREHNDVVMGIRTRRDDGFMRLSVSMVLRIFLLVAFRTFCPDANVPYRLVRAERLVPILPLIPGDFNLANVALSLLLKRQRDCKHAYVPIRFRERYGGEPSVKAAVFGRKAIELYRDLSKMTKRTGV